MYVNGAAHVYAVPCAGTQAPPQAAWQWAAPADGGTSSSAELDGVLFVGADDFSTYALDARSGAELFAMPTKGYIWSDPVANANAAFFGSEDGNFYSYCTDARSV